MAVVPPTAVTLTVPPEGAPDPEPLGEPPLLLGFEGVVALSYTVTVVDAADGACFESEALIEIVAVPGRYPTMLKTPLAYDARATDGSEEETCTLV